MCRAPIYFDTSENFGMYHGKLLQRHNCNYPSIFTNNPQTVCVSDISCSLIRL